MTCVTRLRLRCVSCVCRYLRVEAKTLFISYNDLGAEGAAALAAVRLPMLHTLFCEGNDLGASGAAALTAASWDRLQELDLGLSEIGDEVAAALSDRTLADVLEGLVA